MRSVKLRFLKVLLLGLGLEEGRATPELLHWEMLSTKRHTELEKKSGLTEEVQPFFSECSTLRRTLTNLTMCRDPQRSQAKGQCIVNQYRRISEEKTSKKRKKKKGTKIT